MLTADPSSQTELPDEPGIFVEDLEDVSLIRLVGEHDITTATDLTVAVRRAAVEGRGVAISLTGVTFMDSAVVHALCLGDRTLLERGRRLAVYTEPGGIADRVLGLCGLDESLLLGDTLDEALRFARQSAAPAA